jgi:hypothetical protein
MSSTQHISGIGRKCAWPIWHLDDPDHPAYTTGQAARTVHAPEAFLRSLDPAACYDHDTTNADP